MNLTKGQGLVGKAILIGINTYEIEDEMPSRKAHFPKNKKKLNHWAI
jgi:hypothetical protein